MYREVSSQEIVSTLMIATKLQLVRWTRVTDYIFYNGRNKALLNYTTLFSEARPPETIRDVPHADLTKSYYCEYGGAAFCLMHCEQVLKINSPAESFYNFMVQGDPYDNFGYYNTGNADFEAALAQLVESVEEHISMHYFSRFSLNKTVLRLQDKLAHFDPETETLLGPPPPTPPYKYSCVVDKNGYYRTLVLVYLEQDANGNDCENVQHYTLKEDEHLIDAPAPANLVKARWNGKDWEETATAEEISVAREEGRIP